MGDPCPIADDTAELTEFVREERVRILDVIHDLEWLIAYTTHKLRLVMATQPHCPHQADALWNALAVAYQGIQWWTAAYYLMAFGSLSDRSHFSSRPEEREEIIDRIFLAGGFFDDTSAFVEVPL